MRVLVADDHPLFRDGLVSLLEAARFEVVMQVSTGEAAVEAALRLHPDLVLLDITMPGIGGLEALRQIRAALPHVSVVMVTVSDDDTDLFEALRSGAHGYLLKSLNAHDFLEILGGLERGEAAVGRATTARLIKGLCDQAAPQAEPPNKLTEREIEILQLIAVGRTNKAVAQALFVSENTVKYHLKNILQKLGVENRTEAVTSALHAGLIKSQSSK